MEHFQGAILSTSSGSSCLTYSNPMKQVLLLSHFVDGSTSPVSAPPFITLHWLPIFNQRKFKFFGSLYSSNSNHHLPLQPHLLLPLASKLIPSPMLSLAFCLCSHYPLPGISFPSLHNSLPFFKTGWTPPLLRVMSSGLSWLLPHSGGSHPSSELLSLVPWQSCYMLFWGCLSLRLTV